MTTTKHPTMPATPPLAAAMTRRVLLLDGAMGSLIQQEGLEEADFRGTRFAGLPGQQKGNNELLVLTCPDVIARIHRRYLEAGADVIETDTFNAQRISLAEYGCEALVREVNTEAARLARAEADRMTALTPGRPRYVLGCVGPTGKMLSMSDDADRPEARSLTFDALEAAYREQMEALADGGVDGWMIETVFDTLNAKAALSAAMRIREARRLAGRPEPEVLVSVTVSDASGRTLSGQTPEAFVTSVMHAAPLAVGLNCSLGAAGMLPHLRRLAAAAPCHVTAHPNAGLPNQFGGYDETPEAMCRQMQAFLDERLVNMIGGCCGTTPDHIRAMRRMLDESEAAVRLRRPAPGPLPSALRLSGLEATALGPDDFATVGERCNVAGSRKFLRLVGEKKYDEALDIARRQVEVGATAIDVNMDDGLLDAPTEMTTFLNLVMSDPAVCRVPMMIDSSRFDVIEAGLKCVQGKSIVNSLSLKEGEAAFRERARTVRRLGAAVVVMCFDEAGQATDYERRIAICSRAYHILVHDVGFPPEDVIFDPNVLTVATGMAEHDAYAADFIRATAWVRAHLPGARVSGGLSNLSFAFRGHNRLREAMHAVFLGHARRAGMGMAIMNPAAALPLEEIEPALRRAIDDVVLNSDAEASARLIAMAAGLAAAQGGEKSGPAPSAQTAGRKPVGQRLEDALVEGSTATLEADLAEAMHAYGSPLAIVSGPLMEGMNRVGRLFGEGRMFLPQVVRTARTMKRAVEILRPHMDAAGGAAVPHAGRIVLATVRGDVHDIGKNIVGVVLACNGFEVIDLGVMVPAERIIEAAQSAEGVDAVCLSGLITPSLDEMCRVAEAMQRAGLTVPLLVGGATTSALHTAARIAPLYGGPTFHVRDAAQNPTLLLALLDPARRGPTIDANSAEQARLRAESEATRSQRKQQAESEASPLSRRHREDWSAYRPAAAPFTGRRLHEPIAVRALLPLVDWTYFHHAWRTAADSDEGRRLRRDAEAWMEGIADDPAYALRALTAFYPARGLDDAIELTVSDDGAACTCGCHAAAPLHRHVLLPTPRQELAAPAECLALCDYVAPDGSDTVGLFAATVSARCTEELEALKRDGGDDYRTLLLQTACDRLAEAAAELLHRELGWPGIRPAVGYPVLPDVRELFTLDRLLHLADIGITLTENGAMYPQASVAGLYIGHPAARYFDAGRR